MIWRQQHVYMYRLCLLLCVWTLVCVCVSDTNWNAIWFSLFSCSSFSSVASLLNKWADDRTSRKFMYILFVSKRVQNAQLTTNKCTHENRITHRYRQTGHLFFYTFNKRLYSIKYNWRKLFVCHSPKFIFINALLLLWLYSSSSSFRLLLLYISLTLREHGNTSINKNTPDANSQ